MTRTTRAHRRMRTRYRTALAVMAGLIVTVATVTVGASITAPSQGVRVTCADTTHLPTIQPDGAIGCGPGSSTSTSTSSSTTTSLATTTTSTTRPPTTATCGAPISQTITGDQAQKFNASIPSSATTSAGGATWRSSRVGDYAVTVTGGTGACWSGGQITGEWGNGDAWSLYHYRGGFRCDGAPSLTIENVSNTGYGDAFKWKRGCDNFLLRHVFVGSAADDCGENDYVNAGRIEDSLLNCYLGISSRPSSGQGGDPSHIVTLDRVRMRLAPQPNVYKGTSPGTGGFFKWASDGARLSIVNSTFYATQPPNHQDLGVPPETVQCHGNVILWGGSGSFPGKASWLARCPDTAIVESPANSFALWAATVNQWWTS